MIYELNKIDFYSVRKSEPDKLYLCVTDELDWENNLEDHLVLLQEKLSNYLTFVLNKEYKRSYPDQEFVRFGFLVCFAYDPIDIALSLLNSIQGYLNQQEIPIDVSYRVIPPNS